MLPYKKRFKFSQPEVEYAVGQSPLEKLPPEMVYSIMQYLDDNDKRSLIHTSHTVKHKMESRDRSLLRQRFLFQQCSRLERDVYELKKRKRDRYLDLEASFEEYLKELNASVSDGKTLVLYYKYISQFLTLDEHAFLDPPNTFITDILQSHKIGDEWLHYLGLDKSVVADIQCMSGDMLKQEKWLKILQDGGDENTVSVYFRKRLECLLTFVGIDHERIKRVVDMLNHTHVLDPVIGKPPKRGECGICSCHINVHENVCDTCLSRV